MEKYQINPADAQRVNDWLTTRGGLAQWKSINLSNPGASWTTPRLNADGTPATKPNWQADSLPSRVITDPAEVEVVEPLEVERFYVAVRMGSNGMMMKCTDASTAKIRKRVAHWEQRRADGTAWYEFDYGTQEAVIFVPDKTVPLSEFIAAQVK